MADIESVADSLAELRRLGHSFRSLISYVGDDSINQWLRLRRDGNLILDDIFYHSLTSSSGFFKSIDGFQNLELSAWDCPTGKNMLFKRLIGFELEPRYRSFKARFAHYFEDGSQLTRELCFSSGLIFQPVIPVDPSIASDEKQLWVAHKFELCDRCARGCEMLIEVIEREMAAQKPIQQADDGEDGKRVREPRLSVNARMLEYFQKNPQAVDYSVTKWEEVLGCSRSTIHATQTWKFLMTLRKENGLRMLERQSNAASDKSNAPGKSKKIKPKDLQ